MPSAIMLALSPSAELQAVSWSIAPDLHLYIASSRKLSHNTEVRHNRGIVGIRARHLWRSVGSTPACVCA